jgi:AcrR family transcriptional regulator
VLGRGYVYPMQLTRERIISTAVEIIEREGVGALSMRRIAAQLGSGVMSLYNHIPGKEALLDGVAEYVVSGIDIAADPDATWQDEVRARARAFWQMGRNYPRSMMVVISRPATSAAEMRPIEGALAVLHRAGFSSEDAVRVVRTFIAYIAGSLVREAGVAPGLVPQRPLGHDQAVLEADRPIGLNPAQFPQVTSMAADLMTRDLDADFEFGLEMLVRALSELRPARAKLSGCRLPPRTASAQRGCRARAAAPPGSRSPRSAPARRAGPGSRCRLPGRCRCQRVRSPRCLPRRPAGETCWTARRRTARTRPAPPPGWR